DDVGPPVEHSARSGAPHEKDALPGSSSEDAVKAFLKEYGAAELLNRLRWDSYPEKILLLSAWFEARGGTVPWKSADMDEVFKQAKEKPPANFPRDIKQAIKAAWIHPITPRTYAVTRTGWNRLTEALTSKGRDAALH
ncbi:MAG: hypothetical protein DMF16_10140, partial [Verrucomicrobia bacterium]